MKTKRFFIKILAILAVAIGGVSCHTMHGMGQDIEHAGHAIKDAAD